ncbi:hypothetical protein CLOBY_18020 [Clostridium saccharobutylicum]|uniref:hypothetical protein n=1 Tax=Clostridium saccharobutylicum TaxID=169679 RepID=UPI000983F383|nr:hypothetical protein [Clostridium saccharobutylicum]AQS09671.1 hypothetical protein CLOBY_18020 [Clostridium saccharobutylicum]MBC2436934.1 hypothetical protein [Clostridium saccharobutylicum]NSB89285.1 hypothetical protein [Clostridium saccharobutylicum]NYC27939.1 hypothetical protein [Clostridium saccharobutylicum]OOM17134.1 hypothetical protein CLSAB_20820 [Clostridium saccharobutylicum]
MNVAYSNISGGILGAWVFLHAISSKEIFKVCPSLFLFGKMKYNNFNKIYEYIYLKKFEENDIDFFVKLKVSLNTYIKKYEHKNKGLLNNIVTILISSLITVIIAQYTFQSQANKELIAQIVSNLNNDYMLAFYWVTGIYGIYGILEEFSEIKLEYYILVKNIIDEVEKVKPIKVVKKEYYTSYMKKEI